MAAIDDAISALSSLPQAGVSDALHNAKILIRALSGPDDAIAQACIAEIEAALTSQREEAVPVAWTEVRLREEAKLRGWYVREHPSVPDIIGGGWKHPFSVTLSSREFLEFLASVQADAGEPETVADKIIGEIEERFPNWRGYRDLIDCIDCTLHDLRSGMRAPAEDVEALAYTVANAKLGEGPSVRCEGPTDFEKDQARAWVMRVLAAIRYRSALVPATSQAKGSGDNG